MDGEIGNKLPPGVIPDLTFTDQPSVSGNVKELGKLAQSMVDDQGTLTTAEETTLENAARALLDSPELPAPDRQALANFLQTLSTVRTSDSNTDTATVDTGLAAQLSSEDPDQVDAAINTMLGSRLTPEQKTALRDGILAKNRLDDGNSSLKSWNPDVIKQELLGMLKEAATQDQTLALTPEQEQAIDDAAQTLSTVNIISGTPPEIDPMLKTLTTSTNEAEIFDALKGQVDLSGLSDEDKQAVEGQLKELAHTIAEANKSGTPLGALTDIDADGINGFLNEVIDVEGSGLSETGKAALSQALSSIATSIAVKNEANVITTTVSVVMGMLPPGNPYASPGIMATLAPVLSELAEIYAQIIVQSSALKQNMMGLMLAMAKEAFAFAIAAGEEKVKQLEIEVMQYIASAVLAGVMIGVSVSSTASQAGAANANRSRYMNPGKPGATDKQIGQTGAYQKNDSTGAPRLDKNGDAIYVNENGDRLMPTQTYKDNLAAYNKKVADGNPDPGPPPKFPDSPGSSRTATHGDYYQSTEYKSFSESILTPMMTLNQQLPSQLNSMIDNSLKAIFTSMKIEPVRQEALMNAMKEFITQLIGVVNDTMRTAGDEMQRADKDWQAFNQLFRDFGATIRQSIYGSSQA